MIPKIQLVETAYHNAFIEADKRLAMPLVDVTRFLAIAIRERVSGSAKGPDGANWSPYQGAATWYWAPITEKMPTKGKVMRHGKPLAPQSGQFAGLMAYESYEAFKRGQHGHGARNFTLTGQMWASLRVRAMSPVRVRAAFSGGRRGAITKATIKVGGSKAPTNVQVAKWANRQERVSILQPSAQEIAQAGKMLHRVVSRQWSDQLYAADIGFKSRVLTAKIDRLTTRAGNAVLGLTGG